MNISTRHNSAGFTVIELIVIIVILAAAGLLFLYQKNTLQTANLDERRKTAINSIYYNLEEVYYQKNNAYPAELTSSNLIAMDPNLLTDTKGFKIGDNADSSSVDEIEEGQQSEYVYEPVNCNAEGQCKGYTLRVLLTNEAEYIKKSRHN